jgi:hypothetical protein
MLAGPSYPGISQSDTEIEKNPRQTRTRTYKEKRGEILPCIKTTVTYLSKRDLLLSN